MPKENFGKLGLFVNAPKGIGLKEGNMPEQVLSDIYDEAVKYAYSDLILAICAVESNFNPVAKSQKGAIDLMGILPSFG